MDKSDILRIYQESGSIRETTRRTGLNHTTARRILIDAGVYSTPRSEDIARLLQNGKSIKEIAERLGISEKTVRHYIPYQAAPYSVGEKTKNAKRIAICRQRKKYWNNKRKGK